MTDSLGRWFEGEPGEENYQPGEIIFRAGDEGDTMFVVREGAVELLVGDRVVAVVHAGDVFGEMALIEESNRSATARAQTACKVHTVTRRRFRFMVQENPWFALHVMRTLSDRIRAMNAIAAGAAPPEAAAPSAS
jgi:CRP/FNR family cyclic AMP-dependent transcriptional regulator